MWEFAPQQKQPNQNPLFIGAKWAKKKEFVQWKIQSVSRNDSHILKFQNPNMSFSETKQTFLKS